MLLDKLPCVRQRTSSNISVNHWSLVPALQWQSDPGQTRELQTVGAARNIPPYLTSIAPYRFGGPGEPTARANERRRGPGGRVGQADGSD